MRPYGSLCIHIGLYPSLCALKGPDGSLWVLIGPYASLWVSEGFIAPYRSLCVLIDSYGSV